MSNDRSGIKATAEASKITATEAVNFIYNNSMSKIPIISTPRTTYFKSPKPRSKYRALLDMNSFLPSYSNILTFGPIILLHASSFHTENLLIRFSRVLIIIIHFPRMPVLVRINATRTMPSERIPRATTCRDGLSLPTFSLSRYSIGPVISAYSITPGGETTTATLPADYHQDSKFYNERCIQPCSNRIESLSPFSSSLEDHSHVARKITSRTTTCRKQE